MKRGVILGKKTLAIYRDKRKQMRLPSHIKPPPENIGKASNGKLSADEWNSVGQIALPLVLVPLWGRRETGRERQLLDNYMHLVAALRLSDLRATTPDAADRFSTHYREYLRGVFALFPLATMKPTQHMFGHTPDFLRLFGPIRGWSAWAFEFMNGLAQQILHNWKDGEWTDPWSISGRLS